MIVTAVLWGIGERGIEHAFPSMRDRYQSPHTDRPRAICGADWSTHDPPQRWSSQPLIRAMLAVEVPVDGVPCCEACQSLAAKLTVDDG